MQTTLVVTLIGPDKPGLVEHVSRCVAEHDGSWVESRMAKLAGKFAGILTVQVPADRSAEMQVALAKLDASTGLRLLVEESGVDAPSGDDLRAVKLQVTGHDRAGIVRQLSVALAERSVNVEELTSHTHSAAMSGETMFSCTMNLHVPADLDLEVLRQALEQVGADLMVDVFVGPSE